MQTADQTPQPPQAPVYPQYMPTSVYPTVSKKSSGLIKASFTIGLILFILGLINTALNSWLPILFTRRLNWSVSSYGVLISVIGLLVFFIPGLIGFILGVVGFRRMVKENPPHKYFMAVAGIVMCFGPMLWLLNSLLMMGTSAIFQAFGI